MPPPEEIDAIVLPLKLLAEHALKMLTLAQRAQLRAELRRQHAGIYLPPPTREERRQYMRGYEHGRRNAILPTSAPFAFTDGWNVGQATRQRRSAAPFTIQPAREAA